MFVILGLVGWGWNVIFIHLESEASLLTALLFLLQILLVILARLDSMHFTFLVCKHIISWIFVFNHLYIFDSFLD